MSELNAILARAQSETLDDARMGEVDLLCRTHGVATPGWVTLVNPLLRKLAGETVEYDNILSSATRDDLKYAHAVLSDGPMPTLEITGKTGYDLTHAIFYASNFGAQTLTSTDAVDAVEAELDTTNIDLKCELLACLEILGQPSAITPSIDIDNDPIHCVLVYGFLLGLRG